MSEMEQFEMPHGDTVTMCGGRTTWTLAGGAVALVNDAEGRTHLEVAGDLGDEGHAILTLSELSRLHDAIGALLEAAAEVAQRQVKAKPATVPPGPWDDEPDNLEWIDEATGLQCMILRGSTYHLCGYVRVPAGHPWDGLTDPYIESGVHGGLTYKGERNGEGGGWWVGFDASHSGDLLPEDLGRYTFLGMSETYRTVDYMRAECATLAAEVAEAGGAK